jgi:hypothetical protein
MRAMDCCQLWCNPVAIPKIRQFTGKQRQIEAEQSGKNFAAAGIFTSGARGVHSTDRPIRFLFPGWPSLLQ